ncbi:MAG: hypothetical protein R6U27_03710 [Desulfobacterales bacterium]
MNQKPCDQFNFSQKILIILFGFALLCSTIVLSDAFLRTSGDRTELIIKGLNLGNLSIVSSGRPLRHPESCIPAVNLNFAPSLGAVVICPEYLLLDTLQHSKRFFAP